jgi:hypothetical protein
VTTGDYLQGEQDIEVLDSLESLEIFSDCGKSHPRTNINAAGPLGQFVNIVQSRLTRDFVAKLPEGDALREQVKEDDRSWERMDHLATVMMLPAGLSYEERLAKYNYAMTQLQELKRTHSDIHCLTNELWFHKFSMLCK